MIISKLSAYFDRSTTGAPLHNAGTQPNQNPQFHTTKDALLAIGYLAGHYVRVPWTRTNGQRTSTVYYHDRDSMLEPAEYLTMRDMVSHSNYGFSQKMVYHRIYTLLGPIHIVLDSTHTLSINPSAPAGLLMNGPRDAAFLVITPRQDDDGAFTNRMPYVRHLLGPTNIVRDVEIQCADAGTNSTGTTLHNSDVRNLLAPDPADRFTHIAVVYVGAMVCRVALPAPVWNLLAAAEGTYKIDETWAFKRLFPRLDI